MRDSAVKFVEKVRIITSGCLILLMYLESLDRKYLTILVALSIELTKIIVLRLLEMVPVLAIMSTRSSNPVFLINTTIYVRFGLSRGCLYMRAGNESFNNICIYSSIFSVTVAESISVERARKIFLR